MLKISITVKYYDHTLLTESYLMEAATLGEDCAHVELSDFSHIYDVKNERVAPQCFRKVGEGSVVSSTF